jgi:2-isopropylmalate synthase
LDFSNLASIIDVYERSTGMTVPPRQPYAGELVFTAFSGSHQDAIKKGLEEWTEIQLVKKHVSEGRKIPYTEEDLQQRWDVPYLTIDPTDIGREYREVIRVNSQSGKGGVAYLLESEFGIELPKDMQREFGPIANDAVDKLGREVSGAELKAMFWKEYVERNSPWQLKSFETESKNGVVKCRAELLRNGKPVEISGEGNGPLSALVHALTIKGWNEEFVGAHDLPGTYFTIPADKVVMKSQKFETLKFEISNYSEHALSSGETAAAISYIQIKTADGQSRWGAGVDTNIELASVRAVLSALNRLS